MKSAILRAIAITGPTFWIAKLAIGCTALTYTITDGAGLQRDQSNRGSGLSTRSLLVLLGMYNVMRVDCCILLPYCLSQGKEVLASLNRIKVYILIYI